MIFALNRASSDRGAASLWNSKRTSGSRRLENFFIARVQCFSTSSCFSRARSIAGGGETRERKATRFRKRQNEQRKGGINNELLEKNRRGGTNERSVASSPTEIYLRLLANEIATPWNRSCANLRVTYIFRAVGFDQEIKEFGHLARSFRPLGIRVWKSIQNLHGFVESVLIYLLV